MTVAGVAWVVSERPDRGKRRQDHRVRGVLLAFVGAACQAGGLLLSKQGIGHGWLPQDEFLSPQAATYIRMCFAGVGMIPILTVHATRRRARARSGMPVRRVGSWPAGLAFVACGAIVGPYLGVWMSLVATDRAPLGIAQTLCSLSPIFLLPFAAVLHKERIGVRAILGAGLAVGGSAVLFFHAA
jgi:drug/metabolite transporter (DMT)-like permease